MLCCGYTLTDFPISIRLTSLALWQSNDCPSASKATLMTMDEYFMWIHYERLHNHNKAKHNKTVCIFLGVYCRCRLYHASEAYWHPCLNSDPNCPLYTTQTMPGVFISCNIEIYFTTDSYIMLWTSLLRDDNCWTLSVLIHKVLLWLMYLTW